MRPDELMRKNEAIYKNEIKGKKLTDDQLILKMIENPKLIERPILVTETEQQLEDQLKILCLF